MIKWSVVFFMFLREENLYSEKEMSVL